MLFAPSSGKALRARLRKSNARAEDFMKALEELAKDAGQEVADVLKSKEVQALLGSKAGSLEQVAGQLLRHARTLGTEGRKRLEQAITVALSQAEGAQKSAKKGAKRAGRAAASAKKTIAARAAAAKKTASKTAKKAVTKGKAAAKSATRAAKTVASKASKAAKGASKTAAKAAGRRRSSSSS